MHRIGIASGHSKRATPDQVWEYQHCIQVVEVLHGLLNRSGFQSLPAPTAYYEMDNDRALMAKVQYMNQLRVNLAIEVHLNASGGDYSTCIYFDKEDRGYFSDEGKQLATDITDQFAAAFRWRTIGARGQSYFDRSLAFLRDTAMPAVITEAGFYDHDEQRAYFETRRGITVYATAIFQGICRYFDGVPAIGATT